MGGKKQISLLFALLILIVTIALPAYAACNIPEDQIQAHFNAYLTTDYPYLKDLPLFKSWIEKQYRFTLALLCVPRANPSENLPKQTQETQLPSTDTDFTLVPLKLEDIHHKAYRTEAAIESFFHDAGKENLSDNPTLLSWAYSKLSRLDPENGALFDHAAVIAVLEQARLEDTRFEYMCQEAQNKMDALLLETTQHYYMSEKNLSQIPAHALAEQLLPTLKTRFYVIKSPAKYNAEFVRSLLASQELQSRINTLLSTITQEKSTALGNYFRNYLERHYKSYAKYFDSPYIADKQTWFVHHADGCEVPVQLSPKKSVYDFSCCDGFLEGSAFNLAAAFQQAAQDLTDTMERQINRVIDAQYPALRMWMASDVKMSMIRRAMAENLRLALLDAHYTYADLKNPDTYDSMMGVYKNDFDQKIAEFQDFFLNQAFYSRLKEDCPRLKLTKTEFLNLITPRKNMLTMPQKPMPTAILYETYPHIFKFTRAELRNSLHTVRQAIREHCSVSPSTSVSVTPNLPSPDLPGTPLTMSAGLSARLTFGCDFKDKPVEEIFLAEPVFSHIPYAKFQHNDTASDRPETRFQIDEHSPQ